MEEISRLTTVGVRRSVYMDNEMIHPKRYKATTTVPRGDPFAGGRKREVRGYYVKHITATPNPINTAEGHKEFIDNHTKHYIFSDGFSDWNMPRGLEQWEIDINTLEEI